jgi:gliding motility-associated lipoprotein GldH
MSNKKLQPALILLFGLFIGLSACDTNAVYKSIEDLDDGKWFIKTVPTFDFEIKDFNASYNIYYYVRNSRDYPYYNLYLTHYLTDTKGKKLSVVLDQVDLFDPKTGKPLGSGLGDIYDHKILVMKNYHFPANGKYKMQLKQYMRQDPLPNILSIGIAIEKKSEN